MWFTYRWNSHKTSCTIRKPTELIQERNSASFICSIRHTSTVLLSSCNVKNSYGMCICNTSSLTSLIVSKPIRRSHSVEVKDKTLNSIKISNESTYKHDTTRKNWKTRTRSSFWLLLQSQVSVLKTAGLKLKERGPGENESEKTLKTIK